MTGRTEDLERARTNCLDAAQAEQGYQKLFRVCYNLAMVYFNKGDYANAEELFYYAIEIHEDDSLESDARNRVVDALNGYGASLAYQNKNVDAERAYRGAINLNPNDADTYINLSIVLAYLGWLDDAKKEIDKAIDLGFLASQPSALGDLYAGLGLQSEAIETY